MVRIPRPLVAASLLALASCYPRISPRGPVVATPEDLLLPPSPSGVSYAARERLVAFPVLPFRLWGLDFDEEILFELAGHPVWAMVEVARVVTRDGGFEWFALASERSGAQHVVVGTDEAAELAETFPAPVYDGRLRVIRLEGDGAVEYAAALHLPGGEMLQATVTARRPGSPPPRRNGNAMNHSRDRVLAVLDLEEFNWAHADVFLDGRRATVRLLAPFLPFAWRLQQTAGGLGAGVLDSRAGPAGVPLAVGIDGAARLSAWQWERRGALWELRGEDRMADHVFLFQPLGDGPDGPMELVQAEVRHGGVSVVDLRFNPALPDLRWLPDRATTSAVVAGSNGCEGYMSGRVEVRPDGGGTVVEVVPERPFWACERPIRNRIEYRGDEVRLVAEVAPGLAAGGAGRDACFELDEPE